MLDLEDFKDFYHRSLKGEAIDDQFVTKLIEAKRKFDLS